MQNQPEYVKKIFFGKGEFIEILVLIVVCQWKYAFFGTLHQ